MKYIKLKRREDRERVVKRIESVDDKFCVILFIVFWIWLLDVKIWIGLKLTFKLKLFD